jgi:adenosylmethionine---8-amino-7-oxononanoate aminotransferase
VQNPLTLLTSQQLLEFDRQHIWHPYAPMPPDLLPYPVIGAQGVRLKLADGRELIDGMSSWWAAIHGYNHPALNRALRSQLDQMAHVMFGGLTHGPAVALASRLLELVPRPLDKVFFCDSGSVSVEVAIKMAIQYWFAKDRPKKCKLLTPRGGYHGDTFGAMSVCDPVTGMHSLFTGVLTRQHFCERPGPGYDQRWDERYIEDFHRLIRERADELAAVILEPIVQGAGGMHFYSPMYLRRVRELCDEYQVLLIADEIATGFGRTGTLFGVEHAPISPDIMCIGKALTGGYMTLAATLSSEKVSDAISRGQPGAFMHGPTFMANPLACAVALASIDLLLDSPWQARISRISAQLRAELAACAHLPGVKEVRVLGAIGVVELKEPVVMAEVQPALVERGVWLRPFGKLIYTMPPFVMEEDDLGKITRAITEVLSR